MMGTMGHFTGAINNPHIPECPKNPISLLKLRTQHRLIVIITQKGQGYFQCT